MAKQSTAALVAEKKPLQNEMQNLRSDVPDEALELVRRVDKLIGAREEKFVELRKAIDRLDDEYQVRDRDAKARADHEAEQMCREVAKEIVDHEALMVEALERFEGHVKESMTCLREAVDALTVQRKRMNDLGRLLGIERNAASGFDEVAFVSRCGQRVAGELSKVRTAFGPFLNAVSRSIGPDSMRLPGWGEQEQKTVAAGLQLAREVLGDKPND